MGKIRVLKKSIKFTVRSKRRFIVFLLIFAIVSSFVTFFINDIDTLQTDLYLEQKGLILNQRNEFSVFNNQSTRLLNEILDIKASGGLDAVENYAVSRYADLDAGLRIFSLDVKNPWMNADVNPSLIQQGKYPSTANEIMVPTGSFYFKSTSNNVAIKSDIVVGQVLEFFDGTDLIELTVVGTFDTSKMTQINVDVKEKLWIFLHDTTYDSMLDLYNIDEDASYTYSMSFVVPGLILSETTYQAINDLNDGIKVILSENNTDSYGIWASQAEFLPLEDSVKKATNTLVSLGFAVIGGIILSIMLSYLISRFRRREIAVLKALGYSNGSVRTTLVGEVLTTSISGFFVGMTLVQGILFYTSDFKFDNLLRWVAFLASFGIIVLITLPGIFLISRKILGVSPSEAFRDK